MKKAYFITFEGPEGSGKSTQIKLLKDFFVGKGYPVYTTREPGGTYAGDKIRATLLDKECGKLEPETELFLMLAQRCENLRKVIKPKIDNGTVVLCDRYYDSSMAYQGYARGLDPKSIYEIHKSFLGNFLPDATILLQIEPETGLKRANHNGEKQLDRIELEGKIFHEKVYNGYNELAAKEPNRFIKIDAIGTAEEISQKIQNALKEKFSELKK